MPDRWSEYYWSLAKELGAECLHISRSDMLASGLTLAFVFLINRSEFDLKVGIEAAVATFISLSIVHSARVPWLLVKRMSAQEKTLHWTWGALGLFFFVLFVFVILYTGTWFYTMQPNVTVVVGPTAEAKRIADLEVENLSLRSQLPREESLKMRAMQMSDRVHTFMVNRGKHAPNCIQKSTMTPDEQRAVILPCTKYYFESNNEYQTRFAPQILQMIEEFKAKGIDVRDAETCAGDYSCRTPISTSLKAWALQLGANDQRKH